MEWVRVESDPLDHGRSRPGKQRGQAPAEWRQRNGAHYVLYEETWGEQEAGSTPGSPAASGARPAAAGTSPWTARTTVCIRPQEVSLVRFGAVRWNHTFRPGQQQSSLFVAGGIQVPVRIETKQLRVHVRPDGGQLRLAYVSEVGGVLRWVQLTLRFRPLPAGAVPCNGPS